MPLLFPVQHLIENTKIIIWKPPEVGVEDWFTTLAQKRRGTLYQYIHNSISYISEQETSLAAVVAWGIGRGASD